MAFASACPLLAQAAPPASSELLRLDDRLLRARRVRITTASGWIVAKSVHASAEGLAYRDTLTTGGDVVRPGQGFVSWDDAKRVDVPRTYAMRVGLASALVVGIIGTAAWHSEHEQGNDFAGMVPILVGVPVVGLATVVGAATHGWKLIYRRR